MWGAGCRVWSEDAKCRLRNGGGHGSRATVLPRLAKPEKNEEKDIGVDSAIVVLTPSRSSSRSSSRTRRDEVA